ncbi:MAG: acetyl-CoA hydrolase/transferase C-terminal domain-containing protein [Chloroflexota bacterium]|nr:acetyl-CoA hydrolase/transferase C-terminal domain-containing protein [Chloroflexota bacterium]
MSWQSEYRRKRVTAAEAIAATVTSGARIFLTGNCSVPTLLVEALVAYAPQVEEVELAQVLTVGEAPWAAPALAGHLRANSMFVGPNMRQSVWAGRADYTPVLLSEFPTLFRDVLPVDVAFAHLSPPDAEGFCSFGLETGLAKTPVTAADVVVAQLNTQMPRLRGDTLIHVSELDYIVEADTPLQSFQMSAVAADPVVAAIAGYIATLIPDGATLQMGIGAVPDAVLGYLEDKQDLGVHTELFSDGVRQLVEKGVITGARKTLHPGKITAGFVLGSRELYSWLDDNALVELYPTEYVNDPCIIGQNYRQVAINGAIEVDLTGQVCADSLGHRIYSGVGGQLDFIYGASRSSGGVPIITLPSTAQGGTRSRIVTALAPSAGVVTTRNHIHWVVTEYGAVNLYGKSIRQRVAGLIGIAHPQFRAGLRREASELNYI